MASRASERFMSDEDRDRDDRRSKGRRQELSRQAEARERDRSGRFVGAGPQAPGHARRAKNANSTSEAVGRGRGRDEDERRSPERRQELSRQAGARERDRGGRFVGEAPAHGARGGGRRADQAARGPEAAAERERARGRPAH